MGLFSKRWGMRATLAGVAGVALVLTAGYPSAQAVSTGTTDDVTIVGQMQMPDLGSLGGFAKEAQTAAKSGRATKPRWSLEESAKAPWKGLQAPEGTATGADRTVQLESDAAAPTAAEQEKLEAAAVDTRDLYTWDECEKHDPKEEGVNAVLKNHYALCIVARGIYTFKQCEDGACTWVGEYRWRLTVLGEGVRGSQNMFLTGRFDDWKAIGEVLPNASLSAGFDCLNLADAICNNNNPIGKTNTIAGWQVDETFGAAFNTNGSPAADDTIHYPVDEVNYHELSIWTQGQSEPGGTFEFPFRCDAASYASGGACIYHTIDAKMRYGLTGDGVDQVAAHIKLAQDDPENTKPGGVGIKIPGKPGSKPLTRLFRKIDADAQTYYTANRNRATDTCDYYDPFGLLDKTLDCDEYPFASTWEGANFHTQNPGSAWWFSAKRLNSVQNQLAGSQLGNWYTRDHILAKDPFYVEITEGGNGGGGGGGEDVDSPPVVDAGPDVAGPEGSAVVLNGSADDAENEDLPVRWSYQPVSGVDPGATCSLTHPDRSDTAITCTDDGVFAVTLTANDGVNAPVSDSVTLTVSNVAPTFGTPTTANSKLAAAATGLLPTPWTLYRVGSTVALTTPYHDPGDNDTQQCVVNWDDGAAAETFAGHDKTCDATHRYTAAGMYTIKLTNTDDDGGDDSWTTMVVVYDPDAGWTNADGSFVSPAGAWSTHPAVTGLGWFHLAAHYYKPRDTKPVGNAGAWLLPNTSLRFDTASDTGVDWLVVTPDGKTAAKGHGKLAGLSGEYGFVQYGYDGCANWPSPHCLPGPDKYRTVIWPLSEGDYPTGNAVYDNRASAGYDVDVAEPQPLTSGIVNIQRP